MDPRRSPQRIGNAHLADKLAYLRRSSWSATAAPRLPPPVRSEPGAVPSNHGLRLHDRQGAEHLRSQTIQAGEYQTVQHPERRPFRRLPPQHVKLMTRQRRPQEKRRTADPGGRWRRPARAHADRRGAASSRAPRIRGWRAPRSALRSSVVCGSPLAVPSSSTSEITPAKRILPSFIRSGPLS
jgi:hypothetical protein